MFLNTDNIGYALEILIVLTIIVVIVIFYIVFKIKLNKKKSTIKTNMFKQDEEVNKKGAISYLEQKSKKEDPGISIHLNKKDIKKINNFKIGGIVLLKQSFLGHDTIVNGDLNGKPNLLTINDFYFNIHKYINKLFIEGIFNIKKEDIFKIQKALSKLDLTLLKDKITNIAFENNLIEDKEKGLLFFKKNIIGALNNNNYLLLKKEDKAIYSSKVNKLKQILEKKNLKEKELTSEEEEMLEVYNREKEIQKEINKVLKNKIKVNLLSFDIDNKELYVAIDYNDILNKSLKNLIKYYKKQKKLKNIIFYI